ncbi:MAG: rhomboid family intramembrane serine protease [Lentisphaeria bacterium]|nr:rhomboid family intramembrane serine protease [Lentisphaeria bacterium]
MLDERDYMRRPDPGDPEQTGRKCVLVLIAINVIVFLLTLGIPRFSADVLYLSVHQFSRGMFWQPLTAMFMHGGFSHILFNMWGLYLFGGIVAPRLGGRGFLSLYLSTGVFANLLWLPFIWTSELNIVVCGASGAVMAVTAAAAVMAPETPMLILFIPRPIKLRTMALVYFALDIVMELTGMQPGIANMVHIFGFIAGYLFIRIFFRREMLWDPLGFLGGRIGSRPRPRQERVDDDEWKYRRQPENDDDERKYRRRPDRDSDSGDGYSSPPVSKRELDYLLDKISRSGINSLTPQELQRLKQAREEMRRP